LGSNMQKKRGKGEGGVAKGGGMLSNKRKHLIKPGMPVYFAAKGKSVGGKAIRGEKNNESIRPSKDRKA